MKDSLEVLLPAAGNITGKREHQGKHIAVAILMPVEYVLIIMAAFMILECFSCRKRTIQIELPDLPGNSWLGWKLDNTIITKLLSAI